ncbi:hypothetical protein SAMD00019534_012860 [Acytostelium subglobosum LB1]|uniref:hypothetical protein n=1 Tax=Acytostelium subglobosum LB1 TaxID=1410327 RepID=UPI000644BFE7|nr:hypothetical protein SAMD00019534_012860 [Acytostelium subglobosum LB1]GAM18111.1 hypothetical protein SAMD00019534_012860 [Acytostelium subglobosum LB1]|eukprot:XP_012758707.1 hypothetical protein SAMD00019534_012860 [Acytostelium subglobosum LB1]
MILTLTTAQTSLGKILIHAETGRTLYYFTKDTPHQDSTCYGKCAVIWPPLIGTPLADPTLSGDADISLRTDNTTQATYNGMPLYYYYLDTKAGDVLGENVGQVWFVFRENTLSFNKMDRSLITVDQNGRAIYFNGAHKPYTAPSCIDGFVQSSDKQFQVTMNGYPLHYHAGDSIPGESKGDDINGFFVYSHMLLHTSKVKVAVFNLSSDPCAGASTCQFSNSCFKNETKTDASGQSTVKVLLHDRQPWSSSLSHLSQF